MNDPHLYLGQIAAIDDTPANLHLLCNLLENAGYDVRPFPRGKLALEGIAYSIPDLILLDIHMPEMNGYEVCEKLKSNELTQDIPVIFISALNETFDKVKAFQLGGVDYISKPFQSEEVLARVATHLELYQMKKQLQEVNVIQAQQLAKQNCQLLELNQSLEKANRELQSNYEQLQQAQLQLVQSEKMALLGNLVAGIGHEINNPLGFLSGSIDCANKYFQEIVTYLQLYQQQYAKLECDASDCVGGESIAFVLKDFPSLLETMKYGIDRLKEISKSLRIFARTDDRIQIGVNIHEGLESTLLILKYRLKANRNRPVIQITREYRNLPEISCFLGQLNQVFTNILANAIDMFDEMATQKSRDEMAANPPIVTIRTFSLGDRICIEIQDNGTGMHEEVRARVFDSSFTTKATGKGTGLGMAIAYQIITEKHGGTIACESELGKGTKFALALPL